MITPEHLEMIAGGEGPPHDDDRWQMIREAAEAWRADRAERDALREAGAALLREAPRSDTMCRLGHRDDVPAVRNERWCRRWSHLDDAREAMRAALAAGKEPASAGDEG